MSETHHLTIGRFAPVHAGHALMINHVLNAARQDNAHHTILTTATHDGNKNPLTPDLKVKHLKRAFQTANVEALSKGAPTLLHHLSKLHSQGVKHLVVHAGSDRAHEYHALINKYNNVEGRHGHFNFDSIKVKTVGGTRTDADEGVAGASATKMRKAASSGDEKTFHSMAPSSMSTAHKREMYKDVRRGLGIQESVSFKQFLDKYVMIKGN
jgi:nicotinic acid mononucleotide adenylyltransferase